MKRFLIILGIIFVVAGIVYAGYTLSVKKSAAPGEPSTSGGLPTTTPIESGGAQTGASSGSTESVITFKVLSAEQFSVFSVASDTSVVAVKDDGKIFKLSANGSASPLSSSVLDNFISAYFSSDAQKIIFSFGSPESKQFSVFDVPTRSWTPLANNTLAAAWKPNSHILGYASEKSGLKTIFSLDFDSAKAKPIQLFSLRMEDIVLGWPAADKISIGQKSSGLVPGSALVFDIKNKTFSVPVANALGLSLSWDSSARRALEFSGGQTARGGVLKIISANGETINTLQFLTLPEKCLFVPEVVPAATSTATSTKIKAAPLSVPLEKNVICAVPADQDAFLKKTLPDDYYMRSFFTADNIYKIGLEDGTASSLLSSDKNVDAKNLILSAGNLLFLNRLDNKIYSLVLPK